MCIKKVTNEFWRTGVVVARNQKRKHNVELYMLCQVNLKTKFLACFYRQQCLTLVVKFRSGAQAAPRKKVMTFERGCTTACMA